MPMQEEIGGGRWSACRGQGSGGGLGSAASPAGLVSGYFHLSTTLLSIKLLHIRLMLLTLDIMATSCITMQ